MTKTKSLKKTKKFKKRNRKVPKNKQYRSSNQSRQKKWRAFYGKIFSSKRIKYDLSKTISNLSNSIAFYNSAVNKLT